MKKVLTSLLISLFIVTGCSVPDDDVIEIGYITDTNGLGDQAFNDAVYSGILNVEAAHSDVELMVIEPTEVSQISTSLSTLASQNDIVVAGSSTMEEDVKVVAEYFPDTEFILVDGVIDDMDNVMSLQFREEEAAYLAGVFAYEMSEGQPIGFIGGMDIPTIERFEAGFVQGAKAQGATDEDIVIAYLGSFSDPTLGKQTAEAMYAQGVGYILPSAGAGNLGVFEAAEVNDMYVMGAGTGQFDKSDNIVASHVKSVDVVIEDVLNDYIAGNFESGIHYYGLEENGVDLEYNPNNEANGVEIPQEVIEEVEQARQKIISGEIQVSPERQE